MGKTKRAAKGNGSVYPIKGRPGKYMAEPTRSKGIRLGERRSFDSQRAAWAYLEGLRPAETSGRGKTTLAGWLAEWSKKPGVGISDRTVTFYRWGADAWLDSDLARSPLHAITADDIEKTLEGWVEDKRYSRSSIVHLRRILGTALAAAMRRRLIQANPVPGTKAPGKREASKARRTRITRQLPKTLSDAWIAHPLRLFFEIMRTTGMRPGEVCALTWDQLAIKEMTIFVRGAITKRVEKGKPTVWFFDDRAKTPFSIRNVAYTSDIQDLIQKAYREAGKPKSGWVFPRPDDPEQFMIPDYVSREFRKFIDAAGISIVPGTKRSELTLYSLKAIHITLLLADGIDAMTIAKRVGHQDAHMIMEHYGGVLVEADREAAERGKLWTRRRVPSEKLPAGAGRGRKTSKPTGRGEADGLGESGGAASRI